MFSGNTNFGDEQQHRFTCPRPPSQRRTHYEWCQWSLMMWAGRKLLIMLVNIYERGSCFPVLAFVYVYSVLTWAQKPSLLLNCFQMRAIYLNSSFKFVRNFRHKQMLSMWTNNGWNMSRIPLQTTQKSLGHLSLIDGWYCRLQSSC